jgi:glycosyltransferase involved in cell wall biosynthesis
VSARVLHVLEPDDGGVPQHVRVVAAALAARGWEVDLAAPPGFEVPGTRHHTLPPGPRAAAMLRRLDRAQRYDVVHAHSSMAGALVRATLPRRGRLVYTPHCFAFLGGFGKARALYWAAEQALLPRTGALVACSNWEARASRRTLLGAGPRLREVVNGIPAAPATAVDPRIAELRARGGMLTGFLARLGPQKDPLVLVEAAARLRRDGGLPGPVAVVGNGPLAADVDAAVEAAGLAGEVVRVPFEPPVERYLRGFDVFVLPSRWESLPIAVLEAMACGLPVVATRVGGTAEAVQDGTTGVLVEPQDPAALAAALAALGRDADRRAAMGAAGRRAAQERFGVDRMIDGLEAVYRERMGA